MEKYSFMDEIFYYQVPPDDVSFNLGLFNQYTELNKLSKLNKNEFLAIFFNNSYERNFLELFVPIGKNPYYGLVLDEDNSIDSKSHEIHSFEDYQKYSRFAQKDK